MFSVEAIKRILKTRLIINSIEYLSIPENIADKLTELTNDLPDIEQEVCHFVLTRVDPKVYAMERSQFWRNYEGFLMEIDWHADCKVEHIHNNPSSTK
jgi:hypothetical protein